MKSDRFQVINCQSAYEVCGLVTEEPRTIEVPYCRRIAQFRVRGPAAVIGDGATHIFWDEIRWLAVRTDFRCRSQYLQIDAAFISPIAVRPLGEQIVANAYEPVEVTGMNARTEDRLRLGPFNAVLGPSVTTSQNSEDLILSTVSRSLYLEREYAVQLRENWHIHDGKRRWRIVSVAGTADVTRLPVATVQESQQPQS